jgi:hypothetical protein
MSGFGEMIRDLLDNPDPEHERRIRERRVWPIRPTPDRRSLKAPVSPLSEQDAA